MVVREKDAHLPVFKTSRRTLFKPIDAPCSNLAEVGHAKLASVGRCSKKSVKRCRKQEKSPAQAHDRPSAEEPQAVLPFEKIMTASERSRVQRTEREAFHIALLTRHQLVKKCYGCEGAIKATHDVILQTLRRRECT